VQGTSTRRALRVTVAAWILILVLTGLFQFYRAAVPDGIVFLAMAAALIIGRTGILRSFDQHRWQPRRVLVLSALALAAGVLVLTPRHGIADGVVVVASGILVFVVAWPDPPRDDEADPSWTIRLRRSAIAWSIVGIAFCAWELITYFGGLTRAGRDVYPALSDLIDPWLDNPIGRAIFVALWLSGGVALARRGRMKTP
jgi:hypothetical protein